MRLAILASVAVSLAMFAPATSATTDMHPEVQLKVEDPSLPNVVVVSTGGTIAEKESEKAGGAVPALTGADLVAAVPELKKLANIGTVSLCNIDSSHMTPDVWARLSRTVDDVLARDDISGVVVTHGTDTMAEGAYFLDLTIKSDKPVVFTGAMRDASDPAPDGPGNILGAVTQVLSPNAHDWGVTVTLNQYVNSARDVHKTQTTNVQTFESGEKGYLGYIVEGAVHRFNDRLHRQRLPLPETLPNVVYLTMYAGDDGRFVEQAVEEGVDGIVYNAVGAGNVNPPTFKAIQKARSKGIPVVISSRVWMGAPEPIYGDVGGGADLVKHGCIMSGDLDGPKARLLLMLGVAAHGKNVEALRTLFVDS